jgi:hypothetical protein
VTGDLRTASPPKIFRTTQRGPASNSDPKCRWNANDDRSTAKRSLKSDSISDASSASMPTSCNNRLRGVSRSGDTCHCLQRKSHTCSNVTGVLTGLTTELSDAGGPAREQRHLTWPARIRSSDFVRLAWSCLAPAGVCCVHGATSFTGQIRNNPCIVPNQIQPRFRSSAMRRTRNGSDPKSRTSPVR